LGLHERNGEALASNSASVNLHEKFGFVREGVFRDQHFDGKRHLDVIRFGLLTAEWEQQRDRLRARVAQLDALAANRKSTSPVKS
jgi:RimJ/RimL family protein N-acetyltransferase